MGDHKETLQDQATTRKMIKNFIKNTEKLRQANLTFDSLNSRLCTLESYWKVYTDRHLALSRLEKELEKESYFVNDTFSEVENQYTEARAYLMQKITALSARSLDYTVPASSNTQAVEQISTTATSLPKQSDWDSFKALFVSMVKDAPTLKPTLKLQHLLACVEGDALRTIKNIEVNADNLEVAWTALSRCYENKRLRISVYMKRLLYMPKAVKKSVAEITWLLDTSNECRRGLSALGEPVEHRDRWFKLWTRQTVQTPIHQLDRTKTPKRRLKDPLDLFQLIMQPAQTHHHGDKQNVHCAQQIIVWDLVQIFSATQSINDGNTHVIIVSATIA
ncbi:hypothetical protein TKK_0018793 [Trichogramma kaykai]|uniref:Uncharacterized protein n=1 Tax=Trichogramma kaykai TaxID=54128 RepID=A0ABD2VWJ9_9HYME